MSSSDDESEMMGCIFGADSASKMSGGTDQAGGTTTDVPPGHVEIPVAELIRLQNLAAAGPVARRKVAVNVALSGGNPQIEALLADALGDGRLVPASLPAWRRRLAEVPSAAGELARLEAIRRHPASLSASAAFTGGVVDIGGSIPRAAAMSAGAGATEAAWDAFIAEVTLSPAEREAEARRGRARAEYLEYLGVRR